MADTSEKSPPSSLSSEKSHDSSSSSSTSGESSRSSSPSSSLSSVKSDKKSPSQNPSSANPGTSEENPTPSSSKNVEKSPPPKTSKADSKYRSRKSSSSDSDDNSSSSSASRSPCTSSSTSGDDLSVYSMKFNPSKALQMGQQMIERLPFPKTRRLDNLSRYQIVINASENPLHFESNMINILNKKPLSHKSKHYVDPTETKIERKFLPHQMPIKSNRSEVKLCNLIQRVSLMQGPLAKLREYKEKRIRLCIKTKNVFGGLNEFIAYLIAFDKHWNLALNDVTETFTRKICRKVPVDAGTEVKLSEEQLARRGLVRAVVVKQVGKKHEMCTRHLPQLLLRGSYVVVVTPAI